MHAEVPALMAKACQLFIRDISLRGWICTDKAKRKSLQVSSSSSSSSGRWWWWNQIRK